MARHEPRMSSAPPEIIDVTADNVERTGFFCYMSKRKSDGYGRKLRWLRKRFAEGLRIKMLAVPERGFIEYLPGEYAWRAVHADGYLVIHCLWVVGKSKGKGLGATLLQQCIADAKRSRARGVAMVTSERVWLAGRRILDQQGFECVDTAPPSFSLMVRKFGNSPSPAFAGAWEDKAHALGSGLTVIRSDQCPYVPDATAHAVAAAAKADVECRVVEIDDRDALLRVSPTPYGVFGLALDGTLLSYHYLQEKDLSPLLAHRRP